MNSQMCETTLQELCKISRLNPLRAKRELATALDGLKLDPDNGFSVYQANLMHEAEMGLADYEVTSWWQLETDFRAVVRDLVADKPVAKAQVILLSRVYLSLLFGETLRQDLEESFSSEVLFVHVHSLIHFFAWEMNVRGLTLEDDRISFDMEIPIANKSDADIVMYLIKEIDRFRHHMLSVQAGALQC